MDASLEELAMRGGAWLSLGSWAACEWLRGGPTQSHDRQARVFFVLGLAALVGHSLLAMHVRYAWSGEAALLDAGRRIEAVTGRFSSDGFFANHVFLAWWTAEAAAWSAWPGRYRRRPAAWVWASRFVFAFMFANGAIVFATGPVRVFGAAALLAATWAWVRGRAAPRPAEG